MLFSTHAIQGEQLAFPHTDYETIDFNFITINLHSYIHILKRNASTTSAECVFFNIIVSFIQMSYSAKIRNCQNCRYEERCKTDISYHRSCQ